MPPQLTQRQLASGIVQYIDAHPARMHEDFRNLAVEAMRVAWPCKPSKYRGRNIVRRRPALATRGASCAAIHQRAATVPAILPA
jgi:hypothetical protein